MGRGRSRMPENVRFRWLEIQRFRGFRDPVRFDLDASAVIVSGPNGSGKTSFCDAIQWLLLGTLSRFDPFVTRRDPADITNMYRPGEPAIVGAGMTFADFGEVEVERRGTESPGVLRWTDADGPVYDKQAEDRLRAALRVPTRTDFATYILRAAVLQQDLIRSVLEDKATERYKAMLTLLGLDEIQGFQEAVVQRDAAATRVGERARDALRQSEAALLAAQQRLEELLARSLARPDAQEALRVLQARVGRLERLDRNVLTAQLSEPDALQSRIDRTGAALRRLLDQRVQLDARAANLPDTSPETIEAASVRELLARERAAAALAALQDAQQRLQQGARRDEDLQDLAAKALPLLGEACPVCAQPIDEVHVQARLEDLAQVSQAELGRLRQQVEDAGSAHQLARAEADEAEAAHGRVVAASQALLQVDTDLTTWRAQVVEEAPRVAELGLRVDASALDAPPTLAAVVEDLRELWASLAEYRSRLPEAAIDNEVTAAQAEVANLVAATEEARSAAASASTQEEAAASLQRTTTRATAAVTEQRSNVMAPIVQDIFSRLDPHPTLKQLDFRFDVYYEKGTARPIVKDEAAGVEANPIFVLSSSQANVAALACFLALGWATGSRSAGFALLDDPLQSMDDVNALGFADVCRHLRADRQLIISTHDRRLASLLRRKLAPRLPDQRTLTLEFSSWGPPGPNVDAKVVESETDAGALRVLNGGSAA